MEDLVQFLRDRLDEKERRARSGYYSETHWERFTTEAHLKAWHAWREIFPREQWDVAANDTISEAARDGIRERITAHEADRTADALADIEAKRRLVDEFAQTGSVPDTPERRVSPHWKGDFGYLQGLARAVHLLASVYADHPDFRAEWRP